MATRKSTAKSATIPASIRNKLTSAELLALVQSVGTADTAPTPAASETPQRFDLKASKVNVVAEIARSKSDKRSTSLQVCTATDEGLGETRYMIRSFITSENWTGPKSGVLMSKSEVGRVLTALRTATK